MKHYSSVIKCITDELLRCDLGVCNCALHLWKLILSFALSSGKPCALHSCAHYNWDFMIFSFVQNFWLFMSDWLRMTFHNGLNAVIRQWYVINCLFAYISIWDKFVRCFTRWHRQLSYLSLYRKQALCWNWCQCSHWNVWWKGRHRWFMH